LNANFVTARFYTQAVFCEEQLGDATVRQGTVLTVPYAERDGAALAAEVLFSARRTELLAAKNQAEQCGFSP